MNPLQVLLGILLLFFVPGWLLVRALFPGGVTRDGADLALQVVLGVVTSVALTIVVGTILGFLPGGVGGTGWFQGAATGAPILESVLGVVTVGLAAAAYLRGGLPVVDRALGRTPRPPATRSAGGDHPLEPVPPGLEAEIGALRRRSARLALRVRVIRLRNLWPEAESAKRHRAQRADELARERDELRERARRLRDEAVDALEG